MKLKLKEKELPPIQLRLALSTAVKEMLDRYVAYVGRASGRQVEAREIAVEMLEQFMSSDRDFRQWQKTLHEDVFGRRDDRGEKGRQVNGHATE